MLLSNYGKHSQLRMVDSEKDSGGEPERLFPINTSDDVYVNENGNTLSQFLTTYKDSTGYGPINVEEITTIEVEDSLAALLMPE